MSSLKEQVSKPINKEIVIMDNTYKVLKTYSFTHQAEMDLNVLKNEGIDAYLSDKNMGSFSFLGAATGGVKLHVPEEDINHAQEVLSDNQSNFDDR